MKPHHPHPELLNSYRQLVEILGTEQRDQMFVVGFDTKLKTNEIVREALACPRKGKRLFFDLRISLFCRCQ